MGMKEAISGFAQQFAWHPEINNNEQHVHKEHIILCGMGGSHLAADILKLLKPELSITVHEDYGLPILSARQYDKSLVIASSYSGNTEEVIDAYDMAKEKNIPLMAIAVGGKLIEKAKADGIAYVQIPETGIQPRSALGFSLLGLSKLVGDDELVSQAHALAQTLDPSSLEVGGQVLAERLRGKIPVVYTSASNYAIAYNWKIKFNETGKIPAFYNVLPELNHNEMTGFDAQGESRILTEPFHFIFIKDPNDHPRIQKRFEVIEKLYTDRGIDVDVLELSGDSRLEKIFNSLITADWTAYYTAQGYGLESEQVPMVEEFKKLIV